MRVIVAITGASGALYGIRTLEALRAAGEEAHLILSDAALETIQVETGYSPEDVRALATASYGNHTMGAPIASGSFVCEAMLITPCSMKTLACIANGVSDTLVARAADVMLKEKRRLILCPRETPLSAIHLRNMLTLCELGVHIIPPIPAFYNHPRTVEDIISHHVMKLMDALGLPYEDCARWPGGD